MYPVVQRSFQKLQRQKDGLLAEVSTWPAELLSFRPKPESWSTLNVLDHLVRVERGWLHSVRQNLRSGKSVTIGDVLPLSQ